MYVYTAELVDPVMVLVSFAEIVSVAQVRKYLHVVLCFSPVGDKFRIRARQFPALVNCTAFDWFHTWPAEALVSVATRFLVDIPAIESDTRENIAYHMAFAHQSVAEASRMYLESVRRYNYTTPKVGMKLLFPAIANVLM